MHQPSKAGEPMDEDQPINPQWAYPKSKAVAEQVIREEAGRIPYVPLHLAGFYDDATAVPTLAHQILSQRPKAMQLRYLGTLGVIANERSNTIVFPFPDSANKPVGRPALTR